MFFIPTKLVCNAVLTLKWDSALTFKNRGYLKWYQFLLILYPHGDYWLRHTFFRHVLLLSRQLISKLSFYKVFLPLILLSHLICFCFLALKNADICHLCVLRRNGRSYDEKKGKTFSFLAKSCNPTTVSGDFSLTGWGSKSCRRNTFCVT